MSPIRKCISVVAGAAAGLFLAALASTATASADTVVPAIPGLGGVVDQVLTSSSNIPQLLQSTLGGAPAPATTLAPGVRAVPGMPASAVPGAPAAVPGLAAPGGLSSVFPFPLPNLGGTAPVVTAPSVTAPALTAPGMPAIPAATVPVVPAVPGLSLPPVATASSAPVSAPVAAVLLPALP